MRFPVGYLCHYSNGMVMNETVAMIIPGSDVSGVGEE